MSRADNTAFPLYDAGQQMEGGLTIREYFAAKALQGLCANAPVTEIGSGTGVAKTAVEIADALIAELAKPVSL